MTETNPITNRFFEEFEKSINTGETGRAASLYADTFLFGGPQGTLPVKKDDFLQVLPKRQAIFKTSGLEQTRLKSLEETRLDENYVMVKANWVMRFVRDPLKPVEVESSATYILHRQDDSLRIVAQIDHQDLMKKAQELGLM